MTPDAKLTLAAWKDKAHALLFLPLLLVNFSTAEDWGGDYALYILQAKCLVEGIPLSETGYIYNPDFAVISPPNYPMGFSLLLAPAYWLFGNSIAAFSTLVSLLLAGTGLLLTRWLRPTLGLGAALLLSLAFVYNPWTLSLKAHVMSDIPFLFFLLLGLVLHRERGIHRWQDQVLLGALSGYLLISRTIGIIFLLAILADWAWARAKVRDWKGLLDGRGLRQVGLLVLSFVLVVVLDKLLFGQESQGSYFDQMNWRESLLTAAINLKSYLFYIFIFFPYPYELIEGTGAWQQAHPLLAQLTATGNLLLRPFFFAALLLGAARSAYKNFGLAEFFVIGHGLVLLLWEPTPPRYLLPWIPFVLLYAGQGILQWGKAGRWVALALFVGVMLPTALGGIVQLERQRSAGFDGPSQPQPAEAMAYVRENTPPDAVIVFMKPRVLALYGERRSLRATMDFDHRQLEERMGIQTEHLYFLADTRFPRHGITKPENSGLDPGLFEAVWDNGRYYLYKRLMD